jgi:endoplasmic reticulum junction formation protein lunapark
MCRNPCFSGRVEELGTVGIQCYCWQSLIVSIWNKFRNPRTQTEQGSIYLIRQGITTYYAYRIDVVTYRLEEQQKERAKTIDKLKDATKYNSTQQLLEKYGGAPPQLSSKPKGQTGPARAPRKTQKQPQRTSIGPPATANIPQNQPISSPPPTSQPIPAYVPANMGPSPIPSSPLSSTQVGPPEFAPNAFGSVPQYDRNSESNIEGKWYDRILDLLLGEDETSPRNRIVLICKHCRLVNGQAPPDVKRIEELGKWRCIGCGGWNGEVDEGTKLVEEIKQKAEIETENQPETSISDEKNVKGSSKDDGNNPDEKALEEEEYEEITEEVKVEEETATRKTRSGHRSDTSHTKS